MLSKRKEICYVSFFKKFFGDSYYATSTFFALFLVTGCNLNLIPQEENKQQIQVTLKPVVAIAPVIDSTEEDSFGAYPMNSLIALPISLRKKITFL